jgi:hypothetical protein
VSPEFPELCSLVDILMAWTPNVEMKRAHMVSALLLGAVCFLMGCSPETKAPAFDPIGRWTSNGGFQVDLMANGKYRFCDLNSCSDGSYARPYGAGSFSVVLTDLFRQKNAERLTSMLREMRRLDFYEKNGTLADFDFSVNSGIQNASSNKLCDWKPCVLIGDMTGDASFLAFTKSE